MCGNRSFPAAKVKPPWIRRLRWGAVADSGRSSLQRRTFAVRRTHRASIRPTSSQHHGSAQQLLFEQTGIRLAEICESKSLAMSEQHEDSRSHFFGATHVGQKRNSNQDNNTARDSSTPKWPSSTGIGQQWGLRISIRSACFLHLKRIWSLRTKHLARPCRKA